MSLSKLKDKYSNPFYRRKAAFLTAFTKSLTSSKPSRIARSRKKLSVTKPGKYLKLAHPPKKPPTPPPAPYVPERLKVLLANQDDQGRWKGTKAVLRALGGYIPNPPDGMDSIRWTSALVLAFFKRHPEYWFATEKAFHAGAQYVGDERLVRSAGNALPPGFADAPGSYNDRLDRQAIIQGRWKESEQQILRSVGYMGFVNDPSRDQHAPGRIGDVFESADKTLPRISDADDILDSSVADNREAVAHQTAAATDTTVAEAEWKAAASPASALSAVRKAPAKTHSPSSSLMSRSDWMANQRQPRAVSAQGDPRPRTPTKLILRPRIQLKDGEPMSAEVREFLKKSIKPISEHHESVYEREVTEAAQRRPFYHVGEEVQVRWRRPSRWEVTRCAIATFSLVMMHLLTERLFDCSCRARPLTGFQRSLCA